MRSDTNPVEQMTEFVDYLLELFEDYGGVHAKRMFGGHGIYRHGVMFGLVADDTLYLKADERNRPDFEARQLAPFKYEKRGKIVSLSYFMVPEAALDSAAELHSWADGAYQAARRADRKKPRTKHPRVEQSHG